ncbi:conserved hypothetical protein [Streptomyces sviceus ATCC 29083]|uniref:Uncharacterized protein n=1 Tax=Streptomyces sviceus (strain ATCC 29083 / DSM 924 / JCM 4929 / NBRC 13980 / NCIMB 11184 / NRRL 5439 / UC 5370) TaxID=463191 RepID=B5HUM9_STRX2|nr:conserved hypothetical protein [Streptomyces sviceus ATCC 29083]
MVKAFAQGLADRALYEVWAWNSPYSGGGELDWERVDGLVTRAALAAPFALSVRTTQHGRSIFPGVFSWAAVNLAPPEVRKDRHWFDLGVGLDWAGERIQGRIHEIDGLLRRSPGGVRTPAPASERRIPPQSITDRQATNGSRHQVRIDGIILAVTRVKGSVTLSAFPQPGRLPAP